MTAQILKFEDYILATTEIMEDKLTMNFQSTRTELVLETIVFKLPVSNMELEAGFDYTKSKYPHWTIIGDEDE